MTSDFQADIAALFTLHSNTLLMYLHALKLIRLAGRRRRLCRKMVLQRRRRKYWYLFQASRTQAMLPFALAKADWGIKRRYWVYPRTDDWWQNFILGVQEDDKWVQHFRVSRATFHDIVEELRPELERQVTRMREPIPVEKRVAITLWWLATTGSHRTVAEKFGVGKSTVATTVVKVCLVIGMKLFPRLVRFRETVEVMAGFAALGFPHCVGALGSTHINWKNNFSLSLQATVDASNYIWNCELSYAGEMYQVHRLKDAVPGNPTLRVHGVSVPPLIVADGVYPIQPWLLKPYSGALSAKQQNFNDCLSRSHNVVNCAFGRLKARWQRIRGALMIAEKNIRSVVISCVVLHNMCELKGHPIENCIPPEPATGYGMRLQGIENDKTAEGMAVRDAMADYLWDDIHRTEN